LRVCHKIFDVNYHSSIKQFYAKRTGGEANHFEVEENAGSITLQVVRKSGSSGRVACKYTTKDQSAVAGADYIACSGELVFEHGETSQEINVGIIDDSTFEKTERFLVVLFEATGGARFSADTDGFEHSEVASVDILDDDAVGSMTDRIASILNRHRMQAGTQSWTQQFKEACSPDGGDAESNGTTPVMLLVHIIALPWKLLFALVPPTEFLGGWLCFFVALGLIAVVTVGIADLANLAGCAAGISAPITATTIVALGTSLPDTFASQAAAAGDKHADAALGNITGSNAVNVFLGLGLPWLIGAVYWRFSHFFCQSSRYKTSTSSSASSSFLLM